MTDNTELAGLTDEAHRKLLVQARNLLFEYKYGVTDDSQGKLRGHVPVEHVQKLMILYGNLIAREIWESLQPKPEPETIPDTLLRRMLGKGGKS